LNGCAACRSALSAQVDAGRLARNRSAPAGHSCASWPTPVTLTAIAFAWYVPVANRVLTEPPATAHGMTIAWYAIAAAALALTGAAMQDHWHRYARTIHRLSFPERNPS
jgi:hypothetical protein